MTQYPPGSLLLALAEHIEAEAKNVRARDSLSEYCRRAWSGFQEPWHIRRLVEALEAVNAGSIKRLMVFMPPRHGKSFVSSQTFPAWYLGHHPGHSVIAASYAQDLADGFGRKVRTLLTDPIHTTVFPESTVRSDSQAAHRLDMTARGAYYAVGRGAAITGRGAHLLLIDDPIKDREEANSETVRRGLKDWYREVAYTRLQPGGAVVVIQTRWHEDDLAGWLLRDHQEENWHVVNLPAIAEEDEPFRREGEALWPEAYPLERLIEIRRQLGEPAFCALFQQRPSAAEGAIFKREWWQRYDPGKLPTFSRIVQSWDTAFKAKGDNDPSACTTWGETSIGWYLLHVLCERLEFPELVASMKLLADQWRPHVVLVEDKASGTSAVQSLQRETRLPIVGVMPKGDKIERANAVTPLIQSGRVFLPRFAPWAADYETELASFPAGKHDDRVDSTSQALNWMTRSGAPPSSLAQAVRVGYRAPVFV